MTKEKRNIFTAILQVILYLYTEVFHQHL